MRIVSSIGAVSARPILVLSLMVLAVLTGAAQAAEPVKRIGIYVEPYYAAAGNPGEAPRVAVGRSFDALLASVKKEDILAARDKIRAEPDLVTPMTLMVLAIRLYDVGLRDDAVFWFYAAKDRYGTLAGVLDMQASGLAPVAEAVKNFATLAGPAINGYAFCDVARQQRLRREAFAFVAAHPYAPLFMDRFKSQPGDRRDNLRKALELGRANMDKERAYLADPNNLAAFQAQRRKNEMDARFCWP